MDRRVKERLVGATILVALAVSVIPELLSGPKPVAAPTAAAGTPEPIRNVTVDLATSKAPAPEDTAGAEASSAAAPVHANPSPNANGGANANAGASANGGDRPSGTTGSAMPAPPLETLPPSPTSALTAPKSTSVRVPETAEAGRHGWSVQLGSFANRPNADRLMHQLSGQGFSVYVASSGSGPSLRYRVRIGPLADRGAATQAVAKLKTLGRSGSVVPPVP